MDPSQLFGAWLDDNTFLGGCLEISLDRFATTVQIEAYEVNHCLIKFLHRVQSVKYIICRNFPDFFPPPGVCFLKIFIPS